jgi:hypothetical protein
MSLLSIAHPNRRFQPWEYHVTHGRQLIRSPMGPGVASNVDLMFDGVEYVGCPRLLRGLMMPPATADDYQTIEARFGTVIEPDQLFVLESMRDHYHVVASALQISEHDRDIFSSPFRPDAG